MLVIDGSAGAGFLIGMHACWLLTVSRSARRSSWSHVSFAVVRIHEGKTGEHAAALSAINALRAEAGRGVGAAIFCRLNGSADGREAGAVGVSGVYQGSWTGPLA